MTTTIIYDLGNVLVDWNPDYVFSKVFESVEEKHFFLENVCNLEWNEAQDAGRTIAEGTALKIAEFPQYEPQIRAYYDRWEEMLGGAIEPSVEVFRELRALNKYKFYALTNWSAETFPRALKIFDFLHWFDGRVVSGEEMTRKPHADFYHILLDRYKVFASECLFIDDNLRNIEAAKALDIPSIHFQSAEQLRIELVQRGILK